jgi:gliding motility-associated-like protein
VSIFVSELPGTTVQAVVSNVTCFGNNDGSIIADWINPAEEIDFSWTYNNDPFTGDLSLSNLNPGAYVLSWQDANGCEGSQLFAVAEPSALTLEGDLSLYDGGFNVSENGGSDGAIDLSVEGGTAEYTYDWSHLGQQTEAQDVANLAAGEYTVTVTDANGCQADSTFIITEPSVIEWMTGLTPNGDGFNDAYVIRGIEKYRSNTFKVFNRWGNVVYEKTNYTADWVGQNTDNEPLPDGTYFVIFTSGAFSFETYVDVRR